MVEYDPRWGQAIASIESRGHSDPYRVMGPVTRSGDQALGKYQVMGANVPEWSEAALGRRLTTQEFLASDDAQEAVFKHRFGGYAAKYGNPQDAASAWFTGQPRSQSVGERKDVLGTTGNAYVDKFDRYLGGSEGATAIQHAMRPSATGTSMYGALNPMQPGALAPAEPKGYDWASALQGAGAGLASISSPQQGAALAQIAAQSKKQAANTGTWSMGSVDPTTGIAAMVNSLTGETRTQKIHEPKPVVDEAAKAYKTEEAKAYSAQNQKIAADAATSGAALGNLGTLSAALSDPNVHQGPGGETVAYLKKVGNGLGMNFEGIANADVAASLINKLTQESRNLNGGLPGSLSDRDLAFLKAANPGLDKNPEANKRIIEIYAKLHQRNIEANDDRLKYTAGGRMLDEGFTRQRAERYKAEHAKDNEAYKAEQSAPKTSTPFKTPNGVTWSIN